MRLGSTVACGAFGSNVTRGRRRDSITGVRRRRLASVTNWARALLAFGVPGRRSNAPRRQDRKEPIMLYWAAAFFGVAIVAAILGFGGIVVGAAGIAKLLFVTFVVLAAISLVVGRRVGG
jgi:uncharacterized membrane protein YtjA (UPF0391 family)